MTPEQWLHTVAGILLIAIGLAVAAARRREPQALAFATFAVGFGIAIAIVGAFTRPTTLLVPAPVHLGALFLTGAGLWALFFLFPRRMTFVDRRIAFVAVACALIDTLVDFAFLLVLVPGHLTISPILSPIEQTINRLAALIVNSGAIALVWLFALRVRRLAADDNNVARSMGIFAIGLFVFLSPGIQVLINPGRGIGPFAAGLWAILTVSLPVLLWVYATRGNHPTLARNVAVSAVLLYGGALILSSSAATFAYPVARVLGALLLGYGVLRGQFEGLDLKVRFALSKSTIAAVFIAVFFIVSELAQQFFGEQFGGPYVGILAAGGLVFAIAPLSRLADRIAFKAIPTTIADPAATDPGSDGLADYRAAVRLALRDRHLSRTEERALLRLAERAGISASRALAIHEEVEREGSP